MNSLSLELSKFIGYVLRHKPEKYLLVPGEQGWVPLKELLSVLQSQNSEWSSLTIEDIQMFVENQEKKRYEIQGEYIRAAYGHSLKKKITYQSQKPPSYLYHGTSITAFERIQKEGLKPMSRQYVHLSADLETAYIVGKRYVDDPVLLRVHSEKAYYDEVVFYQVSDKIWLSEQIPATYLEEHQSKQQQP